MNSNHNYKINNFQHLEVTSGKKQKVKALRAMVHRSKPSKGKKSRKAKREVRESEESTEERFVESSGGSSNSNSSNSNQNQNQNSNSVSEYLNSTSSISTSDVRLISMNRRK